MKVRHNLLAVLGLASTLFYLGTVLLPASQAITNGFAAYYTAARVLISTPAEMSRVYDPIWFQSRIEAEGIAGVQDVFFIQPPTMSLIYLPLAGISPVYARWVWTGLSLFFYTASLVLLARTLDLRWTAGLWALPIAIWFVPAMENIRNGQVYLFLLFFLCFSFWALGEGRPTLAGIGLGSMAILKSAGLWLWPLFLLSGRWRVVAWAGIFGLMIALFSLPWVGLQAWMTYVPRIPDLAQIPLRYVTAYQTPTSLFGHLFVFDPKWNPNPVADRPFLAAGLTIGVTMISLAGSLAADRLGHSKDRNSDHSGEILTYALFATLIVTNAPLADGHHYALILPSLGVAYWWCWKSRPTWPWRLVLGVSTALLALPLPYHSPRLTGGWWALFAYPRLYGAYFLWGWLLLSLSRPFRAEPNRSIRALSKNPADLCSNQFLGVFIPSTAGHNAQTGQYIPCSRMQNLGPEILYRNLIKPAWIYH